MDLNKIIYRSIDEYVASFPTEIRENLEILRATIQQAAPTATEKISYGMPTFYLHGNLVHFAMAKNHYGFYPGASGVENFKPVLTDYQTSKGAIQFPLNKPLPFELIAKIVEFRVEENVYLEELRQEKKKKRK